MARPQKAGRNEPCPCGSGRKFKRCCETKAKSSRNSYAFLVVVGAIVIGGLVAAFSAWNDDSAAVGAPGRVWSPEHGHYH